MSWVSTDSQLDNQNRDLKYEKFDWVKIVCSLGSFSPANRKSPLPILSRIQMIDKGPAATYREFAPLNSYSTLNLTSLDEGLKTQAGFQKVACVLPLPSHKYSTRSPVYLLVAPRIAVTSWSTLSWENTLEVSILVRIYSKLLWGLRMENSLQVSHAKRYFWVDLL